MSRVSSARGQASLMMLAVIGVLLTGALVLFAFGNALGARAKHQRGADLAAISAAQVMRELYPRLFEPPCFAFTRLQNCDALHARRLLLVPTSGEIP